MSVDYANQILNRLKMAMDASATTDVSLPRELAHPIAISPWAVWLLLSLALHRGRQQFVLESMTFRLNGDADALAHAGALAHPDCPTVGLVRHDTEWEYRFHGRGCAMTNRLTGVVIDVDFLDETADWITPFFYVNYLESLSGGDFALLRVRELYPTAETVELGFAELQWLGLLVRHNTDCAFKLAFDWRPLCELLEDIGRQWHDGRMKNLVAAAVSDWFVLGNKQAQADDCVLARRRQLEQLCRRDDYAATAIQALADFDYPELDGELRRFLAGSVSRNMSKAVQIIKAKGLAAAYTDALLDVSSRIDPNAPAPAPFIWSTIAELLLKLNLKVDLHNSFLKIQSHVLGEAAILAMEFNLPCAMILTRRALRSNITYNRIQIASALAIIDLHWCHMELKAVLDETTDQESTTECRSALLESRNADVHQFVHQWERKNPYSPPNEKYLTVGEWAKQRNDATIQYEIQSLHDRIYPLRASFQPRTT